MLRSPRRLIRATQGAIAVEFVIAFMPMALAFFSFTQLGFAYTAGIVMRHAATVTARYASVTQGKCMPGSPSSDPAAAAKAALGPWSSKISVQGVEASYTGAGPQGPLPTTVRFAYTCTVPLGKNIVCNGGKLQKEIRVTLPHHGASYNHACE
ncbi:pilus assembly protein [Pendulispora brunnea]|uniref:Pilus assembly protein n=1 Tax=Pendulispora brunnea TaxID=2905690 RepID=A0ABZ2K3C3_9BACT